VKNSGVRVSLGKGAGQIKKCRHVKYISADKLKISKSGPWGAAKNRNRYMKGEEEKKVEFRGDLLRSHREREKKIEVDENEERLK